GLDETANERQQARVAGYGQGPRSGGWLHPLSPPQPPVSWNPHGFVVEQLKYRCQAKSRQVPSARMASRERQRPPAEPGASVTGGSTGAAASATQLLREARRPARPAARSTAESRATTRT